MATQAKFLSFAILCAASGEPADFSLIDQQGKLFGFADRDTPAQLAKYEPLSDGIYTEGGRA